MKKVLKQKSKIDVIQSVIIGVLVLIIILMNLPLVSQFLGRLNPLGPYQAKLGEYESRLAGANEAIHEQDLKNVALEYDRIRLEDANNILLALQDYYFDEEAFPETLGQLREKQYVDSLVRFEDPETKKPYLYRRIDNRFILCVRLSDMVKGVNTQYCDADATHVLLEDSFENGGNLMIKDGVSIANVREQPNASSKVLYKAKAGEPFPYVEEREGWYKIRLDGDRYGWVFGQNVNIAP